MEATIVYLDYMGIWVCVYYNKIPIYPIFYLLKEDYISVLPGSWANKGCFIGNLACRSLKDDPDHIGFRV